MGNRRRRQLAWPEIDLGSVDLVEKSIPRLGIVGVDERDVEPGQFLFL